MTLKTHHRFAWRDCSGKRDVPIFRVGKRNLSRGTVLRVEDVVDTGNGVVDENGLRRLACRRPWTDGAQCLFSSRPSLAVAKNTGTRFSLDAIAIDQCLCRFRNSLCGVRSTLDSLAIETHF